MQQNSTLFIIKTVEFGFYVYNPQNAKKTNDTFMLKLCATKKFGVNVGLKRAERSLQIKLLYA